MEKGREEDRWGYRETREKETRGDTSFRATSALAAHPLQSGSVLCLISMET